MTDQIATIRADLAAWSAGKPKAVQRAAANLDGWLAANLPCWSIASDVNVLACTARAVETLRIAQATRRIEPQGEAA